MTTAAKMRAALRQIARIRHGLDGTETDEERGIYWSKLALEYRAIAREALDEPVSGPEPRKDVRERQAEVDAKDLATSQADSKTPCPDCLGVCQRYQTPHAAESCVVRGYRGGCFRWRVTQPCARHQGSGGEGV